MALVSLLPFIVVMFLGSFVVQEMSMRIGAVTHRGYGELIFQRFGPFWGWMSAADLVLTNLITLITEITPSESEWHFLVCRRSWLWDAP